ncbi:MAG: hypothetical protein RIS79_1271 [Verrucomicrobiota bacterium]|jgi:hypothetical protein
MMKSSLWCVARRRCLFFSPGQAKGELVKRLAHEKPTTRSVEVETAAKLTDRQIDAKVRDHFQTDTPVIMWRWLGG